MTIRRRCAAAVALMLPALLSVAAVPPGSEPLGPERALDLESVADPQLSPDGQRVLYARSATDRAGDRVITTLWLAEVGSRRERLVAEGKNGRWSPDGRSIAYLAPDALDKPQVFVARPGEEGGARPLTQRALPPRDLQWSPDGRWLSYRAPVPGPQPGDIPVPAVSVPEGATPPPEVIDVLPFRLDGLGTHAGAYEHLFVIPAGGGAERQLTSGSWHVGAKPYGFDMGTVTRWAADGSALYFDGVASRLADPHSPESDVYRVDIASGAIEQVTRTQGFWVSPSPSPDGRWVAYIGFDASHFGRSYKTRELWISRADGSEARRLSAPLDGDADDVTWAPDSRGLYFTMELAGERAIYYVPLAGTPRAVTSGGFIGRLASIDGPGRRLAAAVTSARRPSDVAIIDLRRRGTVEFLTAVNDDLLAQVELGRVEEIRFESADGTPLQGWIVLPPGFDATRRYPLVLEIHGGPHDAYNAGFSRYFQAIAARGYVVLYMNPRGSRGYGTDFGNAIQNAFPGQKDYEDLMAGVDVALARGYVDPRRLFVTGCSAGSALTTWIVAHTRRFAAAASLCTVSNWISFAGTADVAGWSMRRFDQPYWEDPSAWLAHSPLMRVGSIETPLLIMTGEDDLRTPMPQSEELFAALKMRGVPTRLVRMRKEAHGTTSKPSNFVRTIVYLDGWFRHWDPVLRAAVAEAQMPVEDMIARLEGAASASWPSFSPDGRQVAYLSTASGIPQVRVASLGDEPVDRALTSFDDPVTGLQWSPTGHRLAVSVAPDGGMNSQIHLVDSTSGEATLITRGGRDNNHLGVWSGDGGLYAYSSNADAPSSLEPYVYDTGTGRTRRLAPGRGMAFASDFSPDSTRLVLERILSRGDNHLWLLDLRTGEETLLTPHEGQATFGFAWFAGSGDEVVMSSNAGSDRAVLAGLRLGYDGRPTTIAPRLLRDDAELELVVLNRQHDQLLLSWNGYGRSELQLANVDGSEPVTLAGLPGDVVSGADFSPDGRRIAIAVSGATSPSAIYVYDLERREFTRVSQAVTAAGLPPLVTPRLEHYVAHDGLAMSGWLYVPAASKGPWPTAVFFHGGPEGQARPFFSGLYQALLSRGIAVFDPNVRGSSGFGQRFMDLDNGALRSNAVRDIESTVRFLVGSGIARPGRIGIAGASYGGYMTMAGLTQYPELFAAGANIFGVVNFESFFAGTEQWIAAISTKEYGDPASEAAMLRELSPVQRVDRIRAPVIVLHGAADTNVPVGEAEQVVAALRRRGIPVEFVLFPNEGHGFLRRENRIRASAAIVSWFGRYLAPASSP